MTRSTMDLEFATVLRVPRPDHSKDDASFVLLHISSTGRRLLDLKLIGTEEENVFATTLKHSQISASKSKKSSCSQDEWEDILLSVLRGVPPKDDTLVQGIEITAKVEKGAASLSITIQKRIEGITQRLGTVSLASTEDEEISLYEWCGSVIQSKDTVTHDLESLQATARSKDEVTRKLEESLAELVSLKDAHENALLEKFSLLLNEKKLKIRDQQRLLSGAKINPAKLEELERLGGDARSRSAGPSRAGKRKVGEAAEDDESNGGFEKMEVDDAENSVKDDSEQEDRRTPEHDSTASEASEDDEPAPPPTRKRASENKQPHAKSPTPAPMEESPPPPPKALPFQRKPPAKPTDAPAADGSETESDDEL
ncbi:hypothetical protein BJ875DRAFT_55083 [Amylocarpus encephaloides]|uniref:Uncharacterized protein n=1 Tax=Amylocarpus encephaloides TaxID=45428 RepID=A0A9P7YGK9_9HELO|nr:hypothetical protein BJ875DRAFT_55083 [Amylocarpus encephaloides]